MKRKLGTSAVAVTRLGLGGAAIGNLYLVAEGFLRADAPLPT